MSTLLYIRDELIINAALADRIAGKSVGTGTELCLVARSISHEAGYVLRLPGCNVIVVAQEYQSNGGGIDVSGTPGATGSVGAAGTAGSMGEDGTPGQPGSPGQSGAAPGSIRLLAEALQGGLFLANGGPGGQGGPGGAGGDGGIGRRTIPRKIDGFPPGEGGAGGNGGDGGPGIHGGSIQLNYLSVIQQPVFAATGGFGASGGAGGAGGAAGRIAGIGGAGWHSTNGPSGTAGAHGANGVSGIATAGAVSEDQYWASVRAALGLGASAWADARLANGEYFYRRANVPSGTTQLNLALATGEFNRVLKLRPNDALATRFDAQISGDQNVLGLSNSLDVTPAFEVYSQAYTAWGSAVFGVFGSAIAFLLGGVINETWRGQLGQHLAELESGVSTAIADLDAAKAGADAWQQNATNAESAVNSLTQQITAAKAAMEDESVSIGGIIGTVLEVASAVVAVVAAIPTAGTSLVALVPAFITLASDVYQGAGAIAAQLIVTGDVPQELKDAYAKAGKDIGGLIAAGKSIMNLVTVINKLDAAKTAANAKYLELVKQALQAGHELLLAMNLKAQADLQLKACQAKVDQEISLVAQANGLLASTTTNGAQLVEAAEILIEAAATRRDDLLRYAFMAQRAVEIYTGRDESTTVRLDSGYVSPDVQADFTEGYIPLSQMAAAYSSAWSHFVSPIQLETDYLDYFSGIVGHLDTDYRRLSFSDPDAIAEFKTTNILGFEILLGDLPQGHVEAKIHSVAVALIGATSPSGVSSCQVKHGSVYGQTKSDGTPQTQILRAHTQTIQCPHTALELSGVSPGTLGDPLEEPLLSPLWGHGLAGQWTLTLPDTEVAATGTNSAGLTEIQVWVAYEFLSPVG